MKAYANFTEDILISAALPTSHKQSRRVSWLPWVIGAVCLCLVTATLLFTLLSPQPVSHQVCDTPISWDMDAGIFVWPEQLICINYAHPPFVSQFDYGFAVEARVLEVLPDTYLIPSKTLTKDHYHILRLQILDTLVGNHMPSEIYYLLPANYSTDLWEYDSLIISIYQMGLENYLMLNATQQRYETFSMLFAGGTASSYAVIDGRYPKTSPSYSLSVLPYNDGKLATSLWTKEGWESETLYFDRYIVDETTPYPIKASYSLSEAKQSILKISEKYLADDNWEIFRISYPRIRQFSSVWQSSMYNQLESQQVLQEMKPFENGAFCQTYDPLSGTVHYQRLINGFWTNECYTFTRDILQDTTGFKKSDVQFTREDLENVPDLVPVVNSIPDFIPADVRWLHTLDGYYYKVGNDVFGVVSFSYPKGRTNATVNIVVPPDGSTRKVSKDVLKVYLEKGLHAGLLAEADA